MAVINILGNWSVYSYPLEPFAKYSSKDKTPGHTLSYYLKLERQVLEVWILLEGRYCPLNKSVQSGSISWKEKKAIYLLAAIRLLLSCLQIMTEISRIKT